MLFDCNLRIYILRLVLLASLISIPAIVVSAFAADQEKRLDLPLLAVSCFVLFHQVVTVASWKYHYAILDASALAAEISVLSAGALHRMRLDRWSTQPRIVLVVTMYTLVTALCLTFIFRVSSLLKDRKLGIGQKINLFSGCNTPGKPMSKREILFGRSIWKSPFKGEARTLKGARGVSAAFFLAFAVLFSLNSLVIEPIREGGLVPVKTFHTTDVMYDFNMAPPVWSIVAFVDMRTSASLNLEAFKAAVNVTPLWDNSNSYKPSCVHLPGGMSFGGYLNNVQSDPFLQSITIFCHSRSSYKDVPSIMSAPSSEVSPDLLVTVNFTKLGMSSDSLIDARLNAVSILVGLTNNTADVMANTLPTPLLPGANLCGSVSRQFRRRFVQPPLASWGLFSSSRTFLVSDLNPLFPDPSPSISRAKDMGTLRIFGQNDFSEWTIVQDYREKSVWAGLAAAGGFWTFLNGLFAIIFGSHLLLILFGIRPLSMFGIVHMFLGDQQKKAWQADYPMITEEAKGPRGLLALLREHLVDVELFNVEKEESTRMSGHTIPLPPLSRTNTGQDHNHELEIIVSPALSHPNVPSVQS